MAAKKLVSLEWALLAIMGFCIRSSFAHEIEEIELPPQEVTGQTSHLIEVDFHSRIPKIFSAKTQASSDQQYLAVRPAKLLFRPQDLFMTLPRHAQSLFEQLRSFHSADYQSITIFDEYLLLYLMPNYIVVVREISNHLSLELKYKIEEIAEGNKRQIKMYNANADGSAVDALKENQSGNKTRQLYRHAILTVQSSDYVYKVGIRGYQRYKIPGGSTSIEYLVFIDQMTFITAEGSKGIGIYQVPGEGKQLKLIQRYACRDLQFQTSDETQLQEECFVSDLSYYPKNATLYVMDSKTGIVQYNLVEDHNKPLLKKKQYITRSNDCDVFDYVSTDLFVLTCQMQFPSYLVEVVRVVDPFTNEYKFVRKEPIYHSCMFRDLIVGPSFYLAFDSYSIDVFWNSQENYIGGTSDHTEEEVNFPGLELFSLKREGNHIFMYVVQMDLLEKYELVVYPGGIYAFSPQPITKKLIVQIPGKCPEKQIRSLVYFNSTECIYTSQLKLSITQGSANDHERKSMSIGIIVLMVMVLFILVWICFKKYTGLESHARKLLDRYRREHNEKRFTL